MLRYKIQKISKVDINLLTNFYKKVFYDRYKSLSNNWRWWYRTSYNNCEPILIVSDNKVIGQAGALPTDLIVNGKKFQAIWFVDFAILPEFRRMGFGKILTKEWMKICPNQITFCNDESLKVFKKFGWASNKNYERYIRPINYFKLIPVIKNLKLNFADKIYREIIKRKFNHDINIKSYRLIENYKTIFDTFLSRKKNEHTNSVEILRDDRWLQWRLEECPYKKDLYFFEHKNNFLIAHIYLHKNIKRLNILSQYYTDSSVGNELLIAIVNWAIKNDIDFVWGVGKKKNIKNIFPSIYAKPINYASWSSDQEIFDILKDGLSDVQGIDSDIDSSLYIE